MRVILLVCDSFGVGEAPDAASYGDEGANTLGNVARAVGGIEAPHLGALGLGLLTEVAGVEASAGAGTAHGKMVERSAGKDSTTGHWEIAGLVLDRPFPTYPDGFPPEVMEPFERAVGKRALGNRPASGTVIIEELGEEHLATGRPIVYTSADSVFQIAAHKDVVRLSGSTGCVGSLVGTATPTGSGGSSPAPSKVSRGRSAAPTSGRISPCRPPVPRSSSVPPRPGCEYGE